VRRDALVLVLLALAGLAWLEPLSAFDSARTGARAVAANVVTDGTAYMGLTGGACTVPVSGGSCTFTASNLGTAGQTYTFTEQDDANSRVGQYAPTGASSVSSGPVSTPTEIAVGSSTTLTATVLPCVSCIGNTYHVHWKVEGAKAGVLDSERTLYRMSITYVA
jgi:hypothetical protein